jgi:hypothetical protein
MSKQSRLAKDSPPNGSQSSDRGSTSSVGYGRPPAHTRFKPGQSGNPKGLTCCTSGATQHVPTCRRCPNNDCGELVALGFGLLYGEGAPPPKRRALLWLNCIDVLPLLKPGLRGGCPPPRGFSFLRRREQPTAAICGGTNGELRHTIPLGG